MLKLARRVYAVFKAYALTDLVRSKGFVFGLMSMSMWLMLFLPSLALFMDTSTRLNEVSGYSFTAILIFLFYSVATWDWAAEIRWMINDGRLEYYIASGSGFLPHFLGVMPISLIWISLAMTVNYLVLSAIWGPPAIVVHDVPMLFCGLTLMIINLTAYALILGGTMLASGVTGFIVEIISFVTPIATGGLTPLSNLPSLLRNFALATPFSYPAEMIRYSLLGMPMVLELNEMVFRGSVYSLVFFALSIAYFMYQLKKIRVEGVRATALW